MDYLEQNDIENDDQLLSAIIDTQTIEMDLRKHDLYDKLKRCAEWEDFSKIKLEERLSPYLQAFINGYIKDSTIGISNYINDKEKRNCKLARNFIDQMYV